MGNTDSIPVVSQTKSFVQWCASDIHGARITQENFTKTCPVISQIRSIVEYTTGDKSSALETQLLFVDGVNRFTDAVPVLGHAKGLFYYAIKDRESGDRAMKSSSRTIGVMGGAAVGAVTMGPAGAFAGGVVAGAVMDGIITEVDTITHGGEFRPHGYIAAVKSITNNESESKAGTVFDLVVGIASDGVTGLSSHTGFLQERPILFYSVRANIDRKHCTNNPDLASHVTGRCSTDNFTNGEGSRYVFVQNTDGRIEVELSPDDSDKENEEERYFETLKLFPEVFFCPITTELMSDPMVCADGHTYERSAIEAWLSTRDTSPMTNWPLPHKQLIPNHALRCLIQSAIESSSLKI